jgi:putative membrane protein
MRQHNWNGYHDGWPVMLMVIVMLLLLAGLVVLIVLLSRSRQPVAQSPMTSPPMTSPPMPMGAVPPPPLPASVPPQQRLAGAEQLLAERFARGEIDAVEYRERLATLRGNAP